ncbi:MAG TPA: bifunctional riboflavin kinase/FAD synthetase [Actinomycetota bacterium]|nr:bifunctional riboflavin kinase/FAD synthetase [Actinomycetota bacterium]
MRTLVGLGALPLDAGGTVVTIGTFDGVHLGHRMLIARTIAEADELDLASCVVTWDRHPALTLRPDKAPPAVSSPERKVELIEELGPDVLVVLPFDAELAAMEAKDFASQVIGGGLHARKVLVGEGWRFGRKAAGNTTLLAEVGETEGFEVAPVHLESLEGITASSTRVRKAIADGDLGLARDLLGRPFDIDGVVEHGDHRGKELGVPTANVTPDPLLVRPPIGVYAGRARVDDLWYTAAINVGVNPTFGGDPATTPVRVEAYLLDFDADLYGRWLRVEFWQRLRDELRFESKEALIEQMHRDIEATRALVEGGSPPVVG